MPPKKTKKKNKTPQEPKVQEYKKPLASGVNPLLHPNLDPALFHQHVTSFLQPAQVSKFIETGKKHREEVTKTLKKRELDMNKVFDDFNKYLKETVEQEIKKPEYNRQTWDTIRDKLEELITRYYQSGMIRNFQFRMKNGHSPFYNIVLTYNNIRKADPDNFEEHVVKDEVDYARYLFAGHGYDMNYDPDIFPFYLEMGLDIGELLDDGYNPKEEDLMAILPLMKDTYSIGTIENMLKIIETNKKKGVYNFDYHHLSKEGKSIAEILFHSMILPFFTDPEMTLNGFNETYPSFTKILKKLAKLTIH
jgi:hypothetical protein